MDLWASKSILWKKIQEDVEKIRYIRILPKEIFLSNHCHGKPTASDVLITFPEPRHSQMVEYFKQKYPEKIIIEIH